MSLLTQADSQERWYLENYSPDVSGKWTVEIQATPFVIGRTSDNGLVLRSKSVSRHHAEINLGGDLLWIRDLGSTNGTYVNQRRIDQAVELKEGDSISIGCSQLVVRRQDSQAGNEDRYDETYMLDMTKELDSRITGVNLEPRLRELLATRAVCPHYQSIVDMTSGEVRGYEVLGRIAPDPELPQQVNVLFELSTLFDLAPELSDLFRMEGVLIQKKMPGKPLFFMNTHPSEMVRLDQLERSLRDLREAAPEAGIVIEIHERSIQGIETLQQLRKILDQLGMGLAYDDFGVGETRLAELARIPPEFLKFDISIIRNIHHAPERLHRMVRTFVDASRELGIATLAEGIESDGERSACRKLGFQLGQGYLFGRPARAESLLCA